MNKGSVKVSSITLFYSIGNMNPSVKLTHAIYQNRPAYGHKGAQIIEYTHRQKTTDYTILCTHIHTQTHTHRDTHTHTHTHIHSNNHHTQRLA